MKNRLLLSLSLAVLLVPAARAYEQIETNSSGLHLATSAADRVGLYGVAPVVQPTAAAQAAITDSTTGTAGTTLAAGVGVQTIPIAIQLSALTTSAADLITAYVPGYRFKVLSATFVTTKLGAGTSASQVLNLAIGSTPVTGGVVTITLAGASTGTDVLGKLSAGTAVTAANVGTATDTLSLKVAASGTVFTAGDGILLIKLQNMDSADTAASLAALQNAIRTGLVATGVIKGS